MDDVQQETPDAPAGVTKPGPCAAYLVGGLSVTLVGLAILVYGIYAYLRFDGYDANPGAIVLGAVTTAGGVTVLLGGVLRAGDALDYLVRTR